MAVIRAGGHVLRGGVWVAEVALPAAGPAPAPEPVPVRVELQPVPDPEPDPEPVPASEPEPEPESVVDQDRADCPVCGKDVAVNKDGSLRKHGCVEV
jgi:hypothetical protein